MSEPRQMSPTLAHKLEQTLARRKQGTDNLREMVEQGRITRADLPCSPVCTGNISVKIEGRRIQGFCPKFMDETICPLVEAKDRERYARLSRAGFGKRYHYTDPTRIRALSAVNEYLAHLRVNLSKGRGIILSGDVGVGKTCTLAYIAKSMVDENVGCLMVHMPEFIEALSDRDQRRGIVERAIKVQVLMLDDLGSGDMPSWVLGILEGIVEHRYSNNLSTIVTTNLDRATLIRVPEFRRMVDRWREVNTWIGIGGTSQRHDSGS